MDIELGEICSYCSALIPPKKSPSPNQGHHGNLALLLESSKHCALCHIIQERWSLGKIQKHYADVNETTYAAIPVEVKMHDAQTYESGLSWGELDVLFELPNHAMVYAHGLSITACKSDSAAAKQPLWKAYTTSNHDKLATMKSWLHDCESGHAECRPSAGHMPKRLIDVGLPTVHPRLVTVDALSKNTRRYTTLSYCWGGSAFKTTKATINSYHTGIPYEILPKTYQDAIAITRSLNIRYLWIDALCIVQDDNTEWQQEASKMQDIYAASTLTIAAADAPDSSVGCFFQSDSGLDLHEKSKAEFFATKDSVDNPGTIVRVRPGDLRQVTECSILNTRGWVLQEMVLSHRAVHCMYSELFWQCKTHFKSETGLVFDARAPAMRHSLATALNPALPKIHKHWWRWMESYSKRRFTIPNDRLSAMAGLVRHYQIASGDNPILGLWERSFTQDLLWMRIGDLNERQTYLPNIPSWSWLSCPAFIRFDYWRFSNEDYVHHFDICDHATLIDWNVNWASEPLVSDVESSKLVISGPVVELTLSVSIEAPSVIPPYLNVNDEKPDFKTRPDPWRCAAQFDSFDAQSLIIPTNYFCLLLRSRENKANKDVREVFLILESVSIDREVYRRIGLGSVQGEDRTFNLNIRRNVELV